MAQTQQARHVAPPIQVEGTAPPPPDEGGAKLNIHLPETKGALVAYDFGEDTGAGFENIGKDEQLTPFLAVLQALSPQCDQTSPIYQPDARPGALINSATGQLYPGDEGVELLASWDERLVTRWIPRNAGGGFRGTMEYNDPLVLKLRKEQGAFKPLKHFDPESGERGEELDLVDQYNVGILYAYPNFAEAEATHRAILAFTSTKIPVFRSWITAMMDIRYRHPITGRMERPPLWAHRVRLVAVPQKNKKGSFFNFRLRLSKFGPPQNSLLAPDDQIYLAAKEFNALWRGKEVKADYSAPEAAGAATPDDEIPF